MVAEDAIMETLVCSDAWIQDVCWQKAGSVSIRCPELRCGPLELLGNKSKTNGRHLQVQESPLICNELKQLHIVILCGVKK